MEKGTRAVIKKRRSVLIGTFTALFIACVVHNHKVLDAATGSNEDKLTDLSQFEYTRSKEDASIEIPANDGLTLRNDEKLKDDQRFSNKLEIEGRDSIEIPASNALPVQNNVKLRAKPTAENEDLKEDGPAEISVINDITEDKKEKTSEKWRVGNGISKDENDSKVMTDSSESPLRLYTNTTGSAIACMIPNVCFSNSGGRKQVLLVPARLRSHNTLLRACVPSNLPIDYYETGTVDSGLNRIDVDVLGIPFVDKFYKHFAHLGPKIIAFSLLPSSLFLSKNRTIVPHCVTPSGKPRSCETRSEWPVRPRIVVGDHVIHNRKGVWNQDFTRLISNNFAYLHVQKFKNENDIPTMCYRSAITSPLRYDGSVELHDRILREKGVQRTLELGSNSELCKPRVVVLLRAPGRKLHRTFPEDMRVKLLETLDDQLKRANLVADPEIIVDLGSGRTPLQQMEVFQRADVLASAHGAELTNALFLRNEARVIELSPFGLYDSWFHKTIRAAHAQETKICAPPDRQQFKACIKDRMVKRGEDRNHVNQSPAMKEFDELANSHQLHPDQPKKCQLKEEESRRCVRKQHILIDAEELSALIVAEVRALCSVS